MTGNRSNNSKARGDPAGKEPSVSTRKPIPFFATVLVMFIMWMIFSGKFDLFHLSLGLLSSFIVASLSSDLLIRSSTFSGMAGRGTRFCLYVPWLLYQILLANIHLLKLVLHPRMMDLINPQLIEFKSDLKNEPARVILANSITLTPGTITVSLSIYGNYKVHAIDDSSAAPLPGKMEQRVAKIFR